MARSEKHSSPGPLPKSNGAFVSDHPSRAPRWLTWARELQAMGQTGLHYSANPYDRENYARIRDIAVEMLAAHTGLPEWEIISAFTAQPGYATVKVDVRAAVVRDDTILLVREVQDGRWAMPGGWADVGEAPAAMVAREVREESGYLVRPTRLVGAWDANRGGRPMEFFHAYKLVFLCELAGGEAAVNHETLGVDFFPFDHLPELSPNRTNKDHIAEIRAHLADPHRPAYFD